MSIRAIDTQMMVARTTDMVREASPLLKNPETFQAQLANMGMRESAENQSKVLATTEAEMENIKTDEDGSGNGAAGGGGRGSDAEEDGDSYNQSKDSELRVGSSSNKSLIDITV
ncbi:MAG: hypothetical protein FWC13_04020 [Oscillospiraceae bacterium]|nr:hypothetical protein [Oscillospiraceae bacterium]